MDIDTNIEIYKQHLLREVYEWGCDVAELRHLTGRLAELYVARQTNGSMALGVNQRGYDVVAANGEKISVKAASEKRAQRGFKASTIDLADRCIIVRVTVANGQAVIAIVADQPTALVKGATLTKRGLYFLKCDDRTQKTNVTSKAVGTSRQISSNPYNAERKVLRALAKAAGVSTKDENGKKRSNSVIRDLVELQRITGHLQQSPSAVKAGMAEMSKLYEEKGRELYIGQGDRERD